MHALFASHGEAFLPAFEKLLPHFTKLLEVGRPWSDLQWGICIFDDLIEYTGNKAYLKNSQGSKNASSKTHMFLVGII